MGEKVTGQMMAKARTNKAFKLDDGKWYEVEGKVEEYLTSFNKPYPSVEVEYTANGYKRKVSYIKVVEGGGSPAPATEVNTGSTSKPQYNTNKSQEDKPDSKYWDKRNDDIKRGNALNAASYALSGTEPDPEALAEKVIFLANKLYESLLTKV